MRKGMANNFFLIRQERKLGLTPRHCHTGEVLKKRRLSQSKNIIFLSYLGSSTDHAQTRATLSPDVGKIKSVPFFPTEGRPNTMRKSSKKLLKLRSTNMIQKPKDLVIDQDTPKNSKFCSKFKNY